MSTVERVLVGGGKDKVLVLLYNITGADVTSGVIYQNSSFINDVTKGNLMGYMMTGSTSLVSLFWDQTTPSPIIAVNPVNAPKANFKKFGGIHNPHGTGATGNLTVTTSGVGTGSVSIILWIQQN